MRYASVRDLKNRTSEIIRLASRHVVMITVNGHPVACLLRLDPQGRPVLTGSRQDGTRLSPQQKKRMLALAARIWKIKPGKGKKWISQQHHDEVLYGSHTE